MIQPNKFALASVIIKAGRGAALRARERVRAAVSKMFFIFSFIAAEREAVVFFQCKPEFKRVNRIKTEPVIKEGFFVFNIIG